MCACLARSLRSALVVVWGWVTGTRHDMLAFLPARSLVRSHGCSDDVSHWIVWNLDMCFFLFLRWYGGFLRIIWSCFGVFWCLHLVVKLGRPDAGIQYLFSPGCGDAHGIVVRDSCCNMFLLFGLLWKALRHGKISTVSNVVYPWLNERSVFSDHCILVYRC